MAAPAALLKSSVGKKIVMAITGIVLSLFVLGHMAGNLQIFLGPEAFNGYARALRRLPELVWTVRVVLVVMEKRRRRRSAYGPGAPSAPDFRVTPPSPRRSTTC